MLVDGLGTASLTNGFLRIEALARTARGEDVPSGELRLSIVCIASVSAALVKIVEEWKERFAEQQDQATEN